jgi:hypothetical protein
MYDLSRKLTVTLATVWWLHKLGKRFKVVWLYTMLTANTDMYYHKSGQVWATHPNTVATPRTCMDDVLKSSSNYRRGKRKWTSISCSPPFVANSRTSCVYVTADCVPDTKTSHCLHWRSANLLSYYSTVRKLDNSENLCRYMARGIVNRFPAEEKNVLFPTTCIPDLGPIQPRTRYIHVTPPGVKRTWSGAGH